MVRASECDNRPRARPYPANPVRRNISTEKLVYLSERFIVSIRYKCYLCKNIKYVLCYFCKNSCSYSFHQMTTFLFLYHPSMIQHGPAWSSQLEIVRLMSILFKKFYSTWGSSLSFIKVHRKFIFHRTL